jgi:leader peptidase (prepilin peptidase)/N-methyltransferase
LAAAGGCMVLTSLAAAPDAQGVLGGALALTMLAIAVADQRHFIIPDVMSGGAFALGLVYGAMASVQSPLEGAWISLCQGVLAGGGLLLIRLTYSRWRGREGIGLGDVKLAGVAGAWLSLPMLFVALEIAALAALGVYFLRQKTRGRPLSASSRLPFGLFFAPAIWLGWLFDTIWT